MDFKCVEVVRQGEFLRYRYAFLPDGAQGHEGSCNCKLFMSETVLSYGEALSRASRVHVSHIRYQQELLIAEGHSPLWVYVEEE